MIRLYNRALAAAGGTDLLTQKESYILLQCRGMHNVSPSLLKKYVYLHEKSLYDSLQALSNGNFWVWNLRWFNLSWFYFASLFKFFLQ